MAQNVKARGHLVAAAAIALSLTARRRKYSLWFQDIRPPKADEAHPLGQAPDSELTMIAIWEITQVNQYYVVPAASFR